MAMTELHIEYRPTLDLVPYPGNARTHSHAQIAQIVASITTFGWTNPVLIDETGSVIAGHGRLDAAKVIGLKAVPTITLSGLDDAQRRALILADNKLALNAGWDEDKLALELNDLELAEFDLALTGFSTLELDALLGEAEDDGEHGDPSDPYTRKIEAPIYQPTAETAPPPEALFDDARTRTLKAAIRAADLPEDIAAFLAIAAERHTIFHFARIAEFYAHAEADVQRLMEASALVIIDFDAAIENGFVKLTKRLGELTAERTDAA
jgi:hypothetical protein